MPQSQIPRSRRVLGATLIVGVLLALVSCGGGGSSGTTPASVNASSSAADASTASHSPSSAATSSAASSAPASTPPAGTLTVFAAASLRNTFTEIGEAFQQANPGSTVTFNFAGSSDLATQIIAGAPADVFASADPNNMTKVTDAGLVAGTPVEFAGNTLIIVTPPGNPAGITGFTDLAAPGLSVVVCAPQVPCGAATERIEQNTGVSLSPVSEESSVTDVLNKVQTGEADAGLVYVTDATAAGDNVAAIEFSESADVVNTYPIATVSGSGQPDLAARFVGLVTGPEGQQILAEAGFQPAP